MQNSSQEHSKLNVALGWLVFAIRRVLILIGVVLMWLGIFNGFQHQYDVGAYNLLTGFIMFNLSEAGRPVVINLFNHVGEQKKSSRSNSGYL